MVGGATEEEEEPDEEEPVFRFDETAKDEEGPDEDEDRVERAKDELVIDCTLVEDDQGLWTVSSECNGWMQDCWFDVSRGGIDVLRGGIE